MKIILGCVLLGFFTLQGAGTSGSDDKATPEVPPYHKTAPRGRDADSLKDLKQFKSDPKMNLLYGRANQVRKVLYQLPCFCKCSRYIGHTSLLSCFREKHATTCDICQKEAIYAFEQAKKGQSVDQIRQDIISGRWKEVDMEAYVALYTGKK
jgi:Protein of unknown function with PCYCGC motif